MEQKLWIEYADALEEGLKDEEITFRRSDMDEHVVFHLMLPNSLVSAVSLAVILSGDADVKMYSRLLSIPKGTSRMCALETINHLNDQFRFIKLIVDEDFDVVALNDFLVDGTPESAAQVILETISLLIRVIDNCMPLLFSSIFDSSKGEGQILA